MPPSFQLPSSVASDPGSPAPVARDRILKLGVVGVAGGFFSGVFGVGGGSVIVPLLVLWLGYNQLEAAATSLAAIALIAAFAAALQGIYGNLRFADGLLVGVPAMGGVMIGAWLARRLPHGTLGLIFAAVLLAAAIELVLQ